MKLTANTQYRIAKTTNPLDPQRATVLFAPQYRSGRVGAWNHFRNTKKKPMYYGSEEQALGKIEREAKKIGVTDITVPIADLTQGRR